MMIRKIKMGHKSYQVLTECHTLYAFVCHCSDEVFCQYIAGQFKDHDIGGDRVDRLYKALF